jgi:ribosomal subunit interface protein
MQLPLQVTFRHIQPSAALEARIHQEVAKLERFYEKIMGCRVVVEAPHKHHHQGNLYRVRIEMTVPQEELVVSREHHDEHAHEDAYVVIRDAFNALQRQLEDYVRRRRGDVKFHLNQLPQ